MKAFMDLHTHSLAAGHAYSTLLENIDAALAVGIRYLGMSEHGPISPGGPHEFFFSNYKVIPREYDREEVSGRVVPVTGGRLHLLCGVEANICDTDGKLCPVAGFPSVMCDRNHVSDNAHCLVLCLVAEG